MNKYNTDNDKYAITLIVLFLGTLFGLISYLLGGVNPKNQSMPFLNPSYSGRSIRFR